jgi:CBS domain-containing protein
MKVSELPPGRLLAVSPDTSLAQVAKRMRVDSSDSVAVMSAKKLVGIITERDLVRAIADGVDPQQARADMFMSADPATVGADEDLSVVAVKMMALGIRHLPVVDAKGAPVGLISAGDLVGMMEKGKGTT